MALRGSLLAAAAAVAGLVAATPAAASITVSTGGGEVSISSTNNVLGTTVSYQLSQDEFVISEAGGGSASTSDGDCSVDGSSVVRCADNGEDSFDIDFGTNGGFVNLDVISGLVPGRFDSNITLGNGSETVDGTDGTDIITAASTATVNGDTIRALDGDDQIITGNGSDLVDGGDDADTIVANDGNNILNGGEFADDDSGDGNDMITGGPLFDIIDGGLGNDILNGGTDADATDGADFDQIDGRRGNDTINAGDGPDTDVDGGPGDDTVNGDSGNDTLLGGANSSGPADADTLNGGSGADLLLNSPGADAFAGGTSTGDADEVDYSQTSGSAPVKADIDGAVGDDGTNCELGPCEGDSIATDVENLTGDGGGDELVGGTGANVIDGLAGNDTLIGGGGASADGADRFVGGTGTADMVDYTGRTGALVVTIDGTANDGAGGCPAGGGCEDDDVETDVENLIGGGNADTLTGSATSNAIFGGTGSVADTLNGSGGDDTLGGGDRFNNFADGADILNGGPNAAGGDTVTYSNRGAVTASLDGVANDPEGDNIGTDVENLEGSNSGGDTLSGSTAANLIDGNGGNDTISGGTGTATDGNDTLIGGTGAADTVSYAPRSGDLDIDLDGVDDDGEGSEADHLETFENITGGSGDDEMTATTGPNVFTGNGGDDQFFDTVTAAGNTDVFNGGPSGTAGGQNSDDGDEVSYLNRAAPVTITMDGVANDGGGTCPGAGCENDQIASDIEIVTGSDADDTFTGNAGANEFQGNGGDDAFFGGTGTGPDGADRFSGGIGFDVFDYTNRSDDITATLGTFGTGPEGDTSNGVDRLTGGSGDDTLRGGFGDETLAGGSGDDTLAGGTAAGADGADVFFAGPSAGDDTVTYANRTDPITAQMSGTGAGDSGGSGGAEGDGISTTIDNLVGGSAGDTLTGDAKANRLDGGGGDDTLLGGALDDTLTGGGGADDIDTGADADTVFAIDGVVDTIECGTEADTAFADASPADATSNCETIDNDGPDPPVEPPVEPPVNPPVTPPVTPPVNPPGGDDGACDAAKAKLAKAKKKLKKAKRAGVAPKVKKAKAKVRRAKAKVKKACS